MIDTLNEIYINDIDDDFQDNYIYFPGWYISRLTKQNRYNRILVNHTRKGTTGPNRIRLLRIFDRLTDQITDQLILSNPLVKLAYLESRTEGGLNAIN